MYVYVWLWVLLFVKKWTESKHTRGGFINQKMVIMNPWQNQSINEWREVGYSPVTHHWNYHGQQESGENDRMMKSIQFQEQVNGDMHGIFTTN